MYSCEQVHSTEEINGHGHSNVRRLWSWGERNLSGAVWLQEYFLQGFVSMPCSCQSPCPRCPGNDDFSLLQLSRFLAASVSHWNNNNKKFFWTVFIKVETSALGVKIAGCILKAEHILLLLVLFCKSIRCKLQLPPCSPWHWFAGAVECVCACLSPAQPPCLLSWAF